MKRLISVTLSICILLCMCPFAVMADDSFVKLLGDANLDSKVNIKDATFIQKYVAHLEEFNEDNSLCADCNIDASVNIKDATLIQKFVANIPGDNAIGMPIEGSQDSTTPDSTGIELPDDEFTTEDISSDTTTPTGSTEPSEAITTAIVTEPTEPDVTVPETTVIEIPSESTTVSESVTTIPQTTETAAATSGDIELPDDDFTEGVEYNPVKPDTNITIYFSNNVNWSVVNAYLYNEEAQAELKSWPGTAMTYYTTNELGEKIYKMDVDVSKYNRVVFNNGKSQTLNAALTVASSGFFITSQTPKSAMQLGVYSYDTEDYGSKTTFKLRYPDGYDKPIEVWTPAGYDANDKTKKYSVIYLLDGQNQFDDSDAYNGGWGSDEIITALMKNGGDGIILVGIDNSRNRDNELTPDIGDVIPAYNSGGFKNGSGERFATFVADTVVPYIEANYNVYTDAAHTAIAGSSSGGIEAFYIGMEHMDEFGRIGALSPAFLLYSKSTWLEYLSKFDFTKTDILPRIYFYNGGGDSLELELLPNARDMKTWMEDLGYSSDKMTFVYDEKNAHNEAAWRNIMPEVVTWLFELQ